jgi:cellulose synthase/poly-beta-1,6-N-acetylglucosamine synthase-like glycosyltransferase
MGGRIERRLLEILPGLITWTLLSIPIWGALLFPHKLALFLLIFNAYWFYKSASMAVCAVAGYRRLKRDQQHDWLGEAQRQPGWSQVHHLILIPTYGEETAILRTSLEHLAEQDFPRQNISVVLAFEERDPAASNRAEVLLAEFEGRFANVWATFHPDVPSEVRGKSSNLAYAGPRAKELLVDGLGVDIRNVLVTVCDADSHLHTKYLSALTARFLSDPEGRYRLYQPALLFYANIWRLPASLRPLDGLYSVWEVARLVTRHRLINQSTYSLALEACHEVGYWDSDVIPEDSRMFFKVFFHYGQQVRVQPIFLPVYADAAEGNGFWQTVVSHYRQTRRWAWGVSDIPYVLRQMARRTEIPLPVRLARAAFYTEDHILWPVHWFLITLGAHAMGHLAPVFAATVLGQTLASLASWVLTACVPCLCIAAWVDWRLRPQQLQPVSWWKSGLSAGSWFLLPVLGLVGSALPALDAHTRLLLGKGLHYQVTAKFPSPPLPPARWQPETASSEAA